MFSFLLYILFDITQKTNTYYFSTNAALSFDKRLRGRPIAPNSVPLPFNSSPFRRDEKREAPPRMAAPRSRRIKTNPAHLRSAAAEEARQRFSSGFVSLLAGKP
ncbi:hypothetical protein [Paenibacillus protaetiae]|uniref:Uncharacterized protein n=1 Tax=Paenibacillus protaetiae TaxID=2509456 RepID=A0A4P6EZT4_9BACL|nr:hypothetical protein [Paenibacillus protaetiae]QAY67329.1 hypothetical protein ET464_13900 [Paenibacillus protaetiae]